MFDVRHLDGIPGPGNNNFKKEKNSGSAVPEIIMFADVQGPRSSAELTTQQSEDMSSQSLDIHLFYNRLGSGNQMTKGMPCQTGAITQCPLLGLMM